MDSEKAPNAHEATGSEASGDTLWGMVRTFYSRPMLSTIVLVWVWALVFTALAVYCAVSFFRTDEVRCQIMHAAIFVCAFYGTGMMKIFAWQMVHKHNLSGQIGRLEARVAECIRACQGRP